MGGVAPADEPTKTLLTYSLTTRSSASAAPELFAKRLLRPNGPAL